MKILLANPRGFCAGVNMAIEVVEQVLAHVGAPVYVYHEIVHNKHVVERLRARGVVFVEGIEQVPQGSVVVYSAHGVSPAVREESSRRGLRVVDATCPLVTKVHSEVKRFAREEYHTIFIGHRKHDEAVGTVGEAPESITVVESPQDVDRLPFGQDARLSYVTQTTLSLADASSIISALKARYPQIKGPPKEDICYATTNRQTAVSTLSVEVDVVLVVGSRNSSNSQRLVETAKGAGKPAYLIDDESEVQPQWLEGKRSVLITAGASAPDHLVQALVERLQREFGGGEAEARTVAEENIVFDLPRSLGVLGSGQNRQG